MSFGIYKMGQGYWVRVLSAVGVGLLGLAAAAWGWGQGGAVRLPPKSYTYQVVGIDGNLAPGATVDLLVPNRETGVLESVGTGVVEDYRAGSFGTGSIEVGTFSSTDTRDAAIDAEGIRIDPGFNAAVGGSGASVTSNPIFPPIYLQAGIAAALLILTAFGVFWFVGFGRKPVDFLVATDGEMKKVHWTTAREVRGSTIVVIVAAFMIAGILYGIDQIFASIFRMIGVLEA